MSESKSITEVVLVLILTCGLWQVTSKSKFFELNPSYLQTLILAIWILIPTIVIVSQGRSFKEYGITIVEWPKAVREAFVMAIWVLPFFIVGFSLFQVLFYSKPFNPQIPESFLLKSFYIILFISLPEEYFFRGYLQTEFGKIYRRKYCMFNVNFGLGLFITAIIFVIFHIWISKNLFGLVGLFPALLFGWLKEKTNGILAPTLFHGLCDITYVTLNALF